MATSRTKKVIAAGLCAATMIGALPASITPAQAMHRGFHHGGYRPVVVHRHRHRGGAVAAGVIGGLALGALAAGAARPAYGDCYIERRRFVDEWGRTFIRRERVCY